MYGGCQLGDFKIETMKSKGSPNFQYKWVKDDPQRRA
jgi:hypothetical protein